MSATLKTIPFPWRPGMRGTSPNTTVGFHVVGVSTFRDESMLFVVWDDRARNGSVCTFPAKKAHPDPSSPSTLGALLGVVREHHPGAHAEPNGAPSWDGSDSAERDHWWAVYAPHPAGSPQAPPSSPPYSAPTTPPTNHDLVPTHRRRPPLHRLRRHHPPPVHLRRLRLHLPIRTHRHLQIRTRRHLGAHHGRRAAHRGRSALAHPHVGISMTTPLRALTLWPEWAWAIHYLHKRVENRIWKIPKDEWVMLHAGKYIGGRPGWEAEEDGLSGVSGMAQRGSSWRVQIGDDPDDLSEKPGNYIVVASDKVKRNVVVAQGPRYNIALPTWRDDVDVVTAPISTSSLLGAFRVLDHHDPHHGNLTGWRVPDQVGNVFEYRPLAAPVPCKGAQGLWHVPDDVRERLTWP